jgi:hypothetical protein
MSMCSDHNTLWRSPVTESAYLTSLAYYSSFVSAPPIVFYTWCIVFVIAVASIGWRVVRGFRAEGRASSCSMGLVCVSLFGWDGWVDVRSPRDAVGAWVVNGWKKRRH